MNPNNVMTAPITQAEVEEVAKITKEFSILLEKTSGLYQLENDVSQNVLMISGRIMKSFMPGETVITGENRPYFDTGTSPITFFTGFGVISGTPKTYPENASSYVQMDEPGNNAKYLFEYVDGSKWKITETVYHTLSLEIQKEVSVYYVDNSEWTPRDAAGNIWKFETWETYYLNGLKESRTLDSCNSDIYDYDQIIPDLASIDLSGMTVNNAASPSTRSAASGDYCIDVSYSINTNPPQANPLFTWSGKEFYSDNGGSTSDNSLKSFTKSFSQYEYLKTNSSLRSYTNKNLTFGKLADGKKTIKAKNMAVYEYVAKGKSHTATSINMEDTTKDIVSGICKFETKSVYTVTDGADTANTVRSISLTETGANTNKYSGNMTINANGTVYSLNVSFSNNVVTIGILSNFFNILSLSGNLKKTDNAYEITVKTSSGNTYIITMNMAAGGQIKSGTVIVNGITGEIAVSGSGYMDIALDGFYYIGW